MISYPESSSVPRAGTFLLVRLCRVDLADGGGSSTSPSFSGYELLSCAGKGSSGMSSR